MNSKMKRMSALVIMLSCTMSSNILMAQAPGYEQGRAIGQQIIGGLFKKKNKSEKSDKKSKKDKSKRESETTNPDDNMSSNMQPSTLKKGEGDVELVVVGEGATKELATTSALRSALEQTYGTLVSSNTTILDDKLIQDEIVSISTGVVKSYAYQSVSHVDGLCVVVLKCIISPQKLVTYVKQKGDASVEISGASFAANVKLKKLNYKNAEIALDNIRAAQYAMLPKCLDYKLRTAELEELWGYVTQSISVSVTFNENTKKLVDLEKEWGRIRDEFQINRDYKEHFVIHKILDIIFSQIRFHDNLADYWFEKENKTPFEIAKLVDDNRHNSFLSFCVSLTDESYDGQPCGRCKKEIFVIKSNSNRKDNPKPMRFILDYTYPSIFNYFSKEEIKNHSNWKEPYLITRNAGRHYFEWSYLKPGLRFCTLGFKNFYTLEEAEHVTGLEFIVNK